jgi:hypothetical protein
MTLGPVVAAQVLLQTLQHQVELDPAEMAARYGADTSVLDWRDRRVCSKWGGLEVDFVVTGTARR